MSRKIQPGTITVLTVCVVDEKQQHNVLSTTPLQNLQLRNCGIYSHVAPVYVPAYRQAGYGLSTQNYQSFAILL